MERLYSIYAVQLHKEVVYASTSNRITKYWKQNHP